MKARDGFFLYPRFGQLRSKYVSNKWNKIFQIRKPQIKLHIYVAYVISATIHLMKKVLVFHNWTAPERVIIRNYQTRSSDSNY